jgi:hypothetical protein
MCESFIAAAMGVSLSPVNRAHMAYDPGGLEAFKPKPVANRIGPEPCIGIREDVGEASAGSA